LVVSYYLLVISKTTDHRQPTTDNQPLTIHKVDINPSTTHHFP